MQNEDTASALSQVLPLIQRQIQEITANPAAAPRLTELMEARFPGLPQDVIQRLQRASPQEMQRMTGLFGQMQQQFRPAEQGEGALQEFVTRLDRAGRAIERTLTERFGDPKFVEAMDKLVQAFSTLANTIVDKLTAPGTIDKLAGYIKQFSDAVGSESFQTAVRTFIDNVEAMASKIVSAMRIHHWGNYRQPDAMAWNTTLGLTQFATGAG